MPDVIAVEGDVLPAEGRDTGALQRRIPALGPRRRPLWPRLGADVADIRPKSFALGPPDYCSATVSDWNLICYESVCRVATSRRVPCRAWSSFGLGPTCSSELASSSNGDASPLWPRKGLANIVLLDQSYHPRITRSPWARIGHIADRSSRMIVRYTTPQFTVEVRRASRHGTGQTAQTWLAESKPQMSESTRVSLRVADTPFRTAPAEEPSQENVPPHRVGRILPSLIDEDAANWALRDSTASEKEAPSPPPVATPLPSGPRPRIRTSRPPKSSQSMPEAGGLPAGESAKAHASEDGAQPNQTAATQLHRQRNTTGPKVRKKESSRKTASIFSEQNQVVSVAEGQTSTAEPIAEANSPSNLQEGPRSVRKRLIIGRYVVGDEFRPGERWQRLLRWKR